MSRRFWFIVLACCMLAGLLRAQPDTLWTRTYSYAPRFFPNGILWGHDGNILMSGIMAGANSEDAFILRLDSEGNFISLLQYGQIDMDEEVPAYVCKTSDGGYALATQTLTNGHSSNYYLARLDSSGAVLGERMYGVPPNDELLNAFITTSDGGFVMAGQGHWSSTPFAFRVDQNGDSLWAREYHFTPRGEAYGIVQTSEGGFAMTGWGLDDSSRVRVFFAKLDSAGEVSMFQYFGGTNQPDRGEEGKEIIIANNDGYLIVARTNSYSEHVWDLFVLRLSEDGDSLWARIIPCGTYNVPTHCRGLNDGSFIIQSICLTGTTYNLSLTRLSSAGETIWQGAYPVNGWFHYAGLDTDAMGRYLMCAERPFSEAYIVLTEPDTALSARPPSAIPRRSALKVNAFPNPFNAQITISFQNRSGAPVSVQLIDILGRTAADVLSNAPINGDYEFVYDASMLSTGIYFIKATAGQELATVKIILTK